MCEQKVADCRPQPVSCTQKTTRDICESRTYSFDTVRFLARRNQLRVCFCFYLHLTADSDDQENESLVETFKSAAIANLLFKMLVFSSKSMHAVKHIACLQAILGDRFR